MLSLLLRLLVVFYVLQKLHTLSKQDVVTKDDVRPLLFFTLILTVIVFGICYSAAFMGYAMSFDAGRPSTSIYIATALLVLAPITFQLIPVIFAWLNMRKNNMQRAIILLKINWWSVTIVAACIVLGLLGMFIYLLPAMMR